MTILGTKTTEHRANSAPMGFSPAPRLINPTWVRVNLAPDRINRTPDHLDTTLCRTKPTHSCANPTRYRTNPTLYRTDLTPHRRMQPPLRVMLMDKPFNPGAHRMNEFNTATLNTLTRVQRFLDDNNAALEDINSSGYRAILDDAVTNLSAHAVNQTASQRRSIAETAKERVLRNNLKLNHMRRIAKVARAQLRQVPEFAALKMPPSLSTSRGLIAWASAMHGGAAPHESTFIAAGLPKTFLAQLTTAAKALETTLATRGAARAVRAGATSGLQAESTRGREAVMVLDSLVEPVLAGNIALLSQWKSAKQFAGRTARVAATSIDAAASGPLDDPQANAGSTPVDSPTPAAA
ncbi:MAG: hypothetical protein ACHQWU_10745 [Gemmatimonadales bacterium]